MTTGCGARRRWNRAGGIRSEGPSRTLRIPLDEVRSRSDFSAWSCRSARLARLEEEARRMLTSADWTQFVDAGPARWDEWIDLGARGVTLELPIRAGVMCAITTRSSNAERLSSLLGPRFAIMTVPGPLRFGD